MRNKKNKLLAFSVLALCVACLAFGVYALKNATLTVNGTVGFTAHDCLVYVVAEIEGDGVAVDANGTVTPNNHGEPSEKRDLIINKDENSNEMLVGGASESEWEKVAPVGAIYFTDLTDSGEVAQIKMTFTLTNQSAYSVTASISNEQFDLANIVVGASEEITLEKGATGTLTATFDLNANDNGEYPEVNNLPFEVKLDFRKATTGGNQGGGEETETPEYLTGIPQTVPEIMAIFDGTPYTATEQPGADKDATAPAGLVGGVTATNENGTYTYMVFDSVGNLNAYYAAYGSMLEQAAGKDNVVIDGLVVAAYMGSGSIGGGEEGEGGETQATQLEQPTGSVNGDILSVDKEVANAIGYRATLASTETTKSYVTEMVMDDSGVYRLNMKTFLSENGAENGTYVANLQAIGDEVNYKTSGYAYVESYNYEGGETQVTQLEMPTSVGITENNGLFILQFAEVENAVEYEVMASNTSTGEDFIFRTSRTRLLLANYMTCESGHYGIGVKAIGDGTNYADSEYQMTDAIPHTQVEKTSQLTSPVVSDVYDTYFKFSGHVNTEDYTIFYTNEKGDEYSITFISNDGSCDLTQYIKDAGTYTVSIRANSYGPNYTNSEIVEVGTFVLPDTAPDPVKLDSPVATLDRVNKTVTITRVEGAKNYLIQCLKDVSYSVGATTTVEQFDSETLTVTLNMPTDAGYYLINIKAFAGEDGYTDSDFAYIAKPYITSEGEIPSNYAAPTSVSISSDYTLTIEFANPNSGSTLDIRFVDEKGTVYGTFTKDKQSTLSVASDLASLTRIEGVELYVEVRLNAGTDYNSNTFGASEYTRSATSFIYGQESGEGSEEETQPVKLNLPDTPKYYDDNLEVYYVANATSHEVKFVQGEVVHTKIIENDGNGSYTLNLKTYFYELEASGKKADGEWTISVKAVGDGVNYTDSDYVAVGTYTY